MLAGSAAKAVAGSDGASLSTSEVIWDPHYNPFLSKKNNFHSFAVQPR